jgi:hypothetical protein
MYSHSGDNRMLLSKDGETLVSYPAAAGVVTLPGITAVGEGAFEGCTGLTSVSLPLAASIGYNAFSSTGPASLIVTLGAAVPTLGTDMFSSVSAAKNVTVKVPSGATGYGSSPANTADSNWGNGFRGGGWDGAAATGGAVNSYISLTIEYMP